MSYFSKSRLSLRQVVILLTIIFLGIAVNSYADVTIPNTFTSGTTISSSQMNANFTAVANQMPAVKQTLPGPWITITSTASELTSISFTAPSNGYAMIFASGMMNVGTTTTSTIAYVCVDLDATSGYTGGCTPMGGTNSAVRSDLPAGFPNTGNTGYAIPYSIIKVIPVTSGTTYHYYLNGLATGLTFASLFQPSMTVLFVPNLLP